MSTAVSVPSRETAVNAEPASLPKKNAEVIRRWADDEIGRNSVRPWTRPSTTASSQLICTASDGRPRRHDHEVRLRLRPSGRSVRKLHARGAATPGRQRATGLAAGPGHDELGPG